MKKYFIKATLIAAFALALFAAAPSADAQTAPYVSWNKYAADCATVMIGNASTQSGVGSACWPTSISAQPGDTINVRIYYHNTGTAAAGGSLVTLNPVPTDARTSFAFTGIVSGGQAQASGQAFLNLPSAQTLTLTGVAVYPDQTPSPTFVSNSSIFNGGQSLGTINPPSTCIASNSFCHQGSVVVSYRISNNVIITPTPTSTCTINSFSASPSSITFGASSTLSWNTSGCSSVSIAGGSISNNYPASGSKSTGALASTTTYVLTAAGSTGRSNSMSAVVNVKPAGTVSSTCAITSFNASQPSVASGSATTLNWNTTGCANVTISGGTFAGQPQALSGWASTGSIFTPTTYTLTATSSAGQSVNANTTVSTITATPTCTVTSFTPNPTSVFSGSFSTLSWNAVGCSTFSINGGNFNNTTVSVPTPTGALFQTTTYTITGQGQNGQTSSLSTTVSVNSAPANCAINSFYAAPTQVPVGGSSTLYWSTSGCTVTVTGPSFNSYLPSASLPVGPIYGVSTYTLTANAAGMAPLTQSVTISNTTAQQGTAPIATTLAAQTGLDGTTATLNGYINSNCTGSIWNSCGSTTYTFQYGTSQYALYNTTPMQTMNGTSGNVSAYIASGLTANTTYYFQLVATNSYGSNSGGILSFVTTSQNANISAITTVPTSVTSSSARLNGLVTGTSSSLISAYFEYGTSPSLGLRTSAQTVSFSMNIFDTIFTTANTTYYYRIVAVANGQTYPGSTVSFSTPGATTINTNTNTNTTTTVINRIGTGGGSAFLQLAITDQAQSVFPGDSVNYVVTYQNISGVTLSNVVINVILPSGVTFRQSSQGVLTTNNTVAITLGTLLPVAQGSISIQALINPTVIPGNNLVTTATAAFTLPSSAQDSAIAYDLDMVANPIANNLAGLALFGAGFFPTSLLGWILLLGLLLLLILIARWFYHRANESRIAAAPVQHVHYENTPHANTHTGYNGNNLPH
jgi:hypothetical protein